MICNKCNFKNEETAKFCRNCGAEMIISQHQPLTPKPKKAVLPWIIVGVLLVCAL